MSQIDPSQSSDQTLLHWQSIKDLEDSPQHRGRVFREFPSGASDVPQGLSRRDFLKLMGGSLALAGVSSCSSAIRKPVHSIFPYVSQPEYLVPGQPLFFATTHNVGEVVHGLLAESYEGRPIKVEGNPLFLSNLGASSTIDQASVLSLYDPDRIQSTLQSKTPVSLDDFKRFLSATLIPLLNSSQGADVGILSQTIRSPVFSSLLDLLQQKYPRINLYHFEPINFDHLAHASNILYGEDLLPIYQFENADIIVSIGDDFIAQGINHLLYTKHFSARRDPDHPLGMNRLYVFEDGFSPTGGKADHRFPIRRQDLIHVLAALFFLIYPRKANAFPKIPSKIFSIIQAASKRSFDILPMEVIHIIRDDLLAHPGRCILSVGSDLPPFAHVLAFWINHALSNVGKTLLFGKIWDARLSGNSLSSAQQLFSDIKQNRLQTLISLDVDLLYQFPADLQLSSLLKLPSIIALSEQHNATTNAAQWVLPKKHYLEAWGDAVSVDGSLGIQQPLIHPLVDDALSSSEFIDLLLPQNRSDFAITRSHYRHWSDISWRNTLHQGFSQSLYSLSSPSLKALSSAHQSAVFDFFSAVVSSSKNPSDAWEVNFIVDGKIHDGRFINNAWLQELPDPIIKVAWDNALHIPLSAAQKLGLKEGDLVLLSVDNLSLEVPVFPIPGRAKRSLALAIGYGQPHSGRIGAHSGKNANAIRSSASFHLASNAVSIQKLGRKYPLACVQHHFQMAPAQGWEARPLALDTTLDTYKKGFSALKHQAGFNQLTTIKDDHGQDVAFGSKDLKSLWDEHKYDQSKAPHQWGMSIDLSKCTACGACTLACSAENNIPIVGKKQMQKGREMHWIRMDRYFVGQNLDDPKMIVQPVACLHCENAPCEQVCPVAATVHSSEGLNDMVYNRCIGTRYCSNNCPYKVRRFNFLDYHQGHPQSEPNQKKHIFDPAKKPAQTISMQFNPDVSIRMRGVMEKCTYCVQRIRSAHVQAKVEGRNIADHEIQSACSQVCAAGAIAFGNLLDPDSLVVKQKNNIRNYDILGELNTKPRTSYLASISNPHPVLKGLSLS